MGLKTLVLGGCGFIGSEFVRQSKDDLIIVDKLTYAGRVSRIKDKLKYLYKEDICNESFMESLFKDNKFRYCINFAAETHVDRSILNDRVFFESNVYGVLNVAKNCLKSEVPYIHISTDEVYGQNAEYGLFQEEDSLKPRNPYSASKASGELIVQSYIQTHNLKAKIIRPCNNYGPYQDKEKFIPTIITKALNDDKIPVYGKGSQRREWIYVSDCIEAINIIINKGNDIIYNIGSNIEVTNEFLAEYIISVIGNGEIEYVKDRLGHDFRYGVDWNKLFMLGFRPKFNLIDGLKNTIEYYVQEALERNVK